MPNQPPTRCAQCLIRIGLKSDFPDSWVDSGSVGDAGGGAALSQGVELLHRAQRSLRELLQIALIVAQKPEKKRFQHFTDHQSRLNVLISLVLHPLEQPQSFRFFPF